jgi:biotin carboxylase
MDVNEEIESQVNDMVNRLGKGWQIKNGVLHIEYKVASGKIYVIEAAARIAGDNISELVELQYGVNLEESFIRVRSELPVEVNSKKLNKNRIHGIRFIFNENDINSINEAEFIEVVNLEFTELENANNKVDYSFANRKGHAIVSCDKAYFKELTTLIQR